MTMTMTGQLTESLQSLVDSRLDTIDRMLVGRLPRQDRLAIVREVESQIFELLQGLGPDERTRDDVLRVLGRLDPPEAYLPDDEDGVEAVPRRQPRVVRPASGHPASITSDSHARLGRFCGYAGMISAVLLLLSPLIYVLLTTLAAKGNNVAGVVFLLLAYGVSMFSTAVLGVGGGLYTRFSSNSSVAGGVAGILPLLASIALFGFLALELVWS